MILTNKLCKINQFAITFSKLLFFKQCPSKYLFHSCVVNQQSQVVYLRQHHKKKKSCKDQYHDEDDTGVETSDFDYKDSDALDSECRPDTLSKKRNKGIAVTVTKDNQYDMLNQVLSPLCDVPYEKQLKMKWRFSRYVINQFCSSKKKKNCYFEDTVPSPQVEGFRNKSELNIRNSVDGNPKTVGFYIGSTGIDSESVICVPPTNQITLPERHKQLVQLYQHFIRQSELPAMHNLYDNGYWKGIIIRTNNTTGETMFISIVHPQSYTDKEIYDNIIKLKEFFESNNANIDSLYHQSSRHVRSTDPMSYYLTSGVPSLSETLHGYKFRISPASFFQVNQPAAELLYKHVIKVAKLQSNSVVLDLCCGTGAISLLCSEHVRCCIGVDSVSQAVQDAEATAKLNNVTNCEFIHGKIEKVLQKVLDSLKYANDIVAIINPPRNGTTPSVIKAIRYCKQINRLVYVTCKGDSPSTLKNFKDLCDENLCTGAQFTVTSVTPVDLFPHTHQCELIILFER